MYGDTHVIRSLARGLRERAVDLHVEADDLERRAAAVPWSGLAADAMRHVALEDAHGLRACADAHDTAADALDRHAREVDSVKELIAAIEHRVHGLLDSATTGLAGLAGLVGHVVPGSLEQWARDFDPPQSGSLAWLGVQVPGWA